MDTHQVLYVLVNHSRIGLGRWDGEREGGRGDKESENKYVIYMYMYTYTHILLTVLEVALLELLSERTDHS